MAKGGGSLRSILSEVLSRRDPEGYYVIVYPREAGRYVEELAAQGRLLVDYVGDTVIVRTKARSLAKEVVVRLFEKGFRPLSG